MVQQCWRLVEVTGQGLSPQEIISKAEENDLPNGIVVTSNSAELELRVNHNE